MRLISLILFFCGITITSLAEKLPNETLHYVISYKWGLIHKDAGEAVLALRSVGNKYNLKLTARTKPWADKFFMVRDTLIGQMSISDLRPLSYIKIANEGGKYGKDMITYSYFGSEVTGHCKRFKRDKKGNESSTTKTLKATGMVYDMLSVFYYLRTIDYASLSAGKVIKATVFSGSKAELMTIRSLGKEKIKLRNKQEVEAYHIKFNFTSEGRKKSSDDIDTWISTDRSHIPLYLVGTLPVGQVRAYFIP